MSRLIIELPEHVYKQLVKQAEKQQKLPEELATEKVIAAFGRGVRSQSQAKRIAKAFLAACLGDALTPQTPSLDEEQAVWRTPVTMKLAGKVIPEVGILEIDVKTGDVLTESPSFTALRKRFRTLLGIEAFPPEKQARLSKLLALNNDGALTPEQTDELQQLMKEADAQEAENLQRVASRFSVRKRKR
jgi:hypothetical protein